MEYSTVNWNPPVDVDLMMNKASARGSGNAQQVNSGSNDEKKHGLSAPQEPFAMAIDAVHRHYLIKYFKTCFLNLFYR